MLLVGEAVEEVGEELGDEVADEVGDDDGDVVADDDGEDERVVLVDGSLVEVDVPAGPGVDSGALLRPPNDGAAKSWTSVPSRASFMKAVQTRTGMLPPVTSPRPPSPLSDSCTARPFFTPPRYSPTAVASCGV